MKDLEISFRNDMKKLEFFLINKINFAKWQMIGSFVVMGILSFIAGHYGI